MTGSGDVLLLFGIVIAWLLLQWVVFPRLGVPT
jgi:hypothetical protein